MLTMLVISECSLLTVTAIDRLQTSLERDLAMGSVMTEGFTERGCWPAEVILSEGIHRQ